MKIEDAVEVLGQMFAACANDRRMQEADALAAAILAFTELKTLRANPSAGVAGAVAWEGIARALFDYHKSGKPAPFGPMASWEETTDAVRERYLKQAAALREAITTRPAPVEAAESGTGEAKKRTEHELKIIADLRAMAATQDNGFWPRMLAQGVLGMLGESLSPPTLAQQGDSDGT